MVQDRYRQDCLSYAQILVEHVEKHNMLHEIRESSDYIEACVIVRKQCDQVEKINKMWYTIAKSRPGAITMDQLILSIVFYLQRPHFKVLDLGPLA